MKKRTSLKLMLLVVSMVFTAAISSHAVTPALSFTGGSGYQGNGDGNVGWGFTLTAPIQLTNLGYYDDGSDGLMFSHAIGIFNGAGTLVISATVPAGTVASLLNGFRYVSVNSFTLAPGSYVLDAAVQANSDSFYASATTVTTAAGITYDSPRAGGGTGLVLPTGNPFPFNNGYFGPNFQFNAVPEPATWALCGAGAVGVGIVLRRRGARATETI